VGPRGQLLRNTVGMTVGVGEVAGLMLMPRDEHA